MYIEKLTKYTQNLELGFKVAACKKGHETQYYEIKYVREK